MEMLSKIVVDGKYLNEVDWKQVMFFNVAIRSTTQNQTELKLSFLKMHM